jgi:flagellar motor switch protein FliN
MMMTETKTTDKTTRIKIKTDGPSNFSIFPSHDFITEQSEKILTGLFKVRIKMTLLKSSTNPKSLQGQMDAFTPYLTIQVRFTGMTDEISILSEISILELFKKVLSQDKKTETFNEREIFPLIRHYAHQFFNELAENVKGKTGSGPEIQSIRLSLYKPMEQAFQSSCCRSADMIMTVMDGSSSHVLRCVFKAPLANLFQLSGNRKNWADPSDSKVQIRMNQFIPLESQLGEERRNWQSLMNLELPVSVELGRIRMFVKDIIGLSPGSLVQMDKLAGEGVDFYVNDVKIAEGEVVLNTRNVGVKITALIGKTERLSKID